MPLNEQTYERGVSLLKGSYIDLGVSVVSLAVSSGFLIAGVAAMIKNDTDRGSADTERILALQPVMFLVAQSFTVTTTWRDRGMFHEFDIARPTLVNVRQSFIFFLLALVLLAHVLGNVVPSKWCAFYALGSLWVVVSALHVSRTMRNWNYSDIFHSVHEEDLKDIFEKILGISQGSHEYKVFVWLSFMGALITTQAVCWSWKDEDMSFTYKGTNTLLTLWAMTSTVHMAKLCRDRADPVIGESLKEQYLFQFMVVASYIGSSLLILVIVFTLEVDDWQQYTLTVGWGFIMASVFFVSKLVRDVREASHLIKFAEAPYADSAGHLPQPIYPDQFPKPQSNGTNGQSPRAVSSSIQPIMDLTAPLERRGQAAKLIGQRSHNLSLEDSYAVEGDYMKSGYANGPSQINASVNKNWRGLATE